MKNSNNYYFHTYATYERTSADLSLSENPLGPSPRAIQAIIEAASKSHLYPCLEKKLIHLIAQHHNIPLDTILLGAGANQLLEDYLKVMALGKNIIVPTATFPESIACMATLQGSYKAVSLHPDFTLDLNALLYACTSDSRLIHLCNPNNPTGIWTESNRLIQLAERSPVPILVSEAGADVARKTILDQSLHPNLIIVRSFSKAYGLAGLRIGYSIASPKITAMMKSKLRSYRVSSLAVAAAIAAIQDQEHLNHSVAYILKEKAWLMCEMRNLGFKVVPSQGQTFIAEVPEEFDNAKHFCALAKSYDTAMVDCSLYAGLERYVRISPQMRPINNKFIVNLKIIIKDKQNEHK